MESHVAVSLAGADAVGRGEGRGGVHAVSEMGPAYRVHLHREDGKTADGDGVRIAGEQPARDRGADRPDDARPEVHRGIREPEVPGRRDVRPLDLPPGVRLRHIGQSAHRHGPGDDGLVARTDRAVAEQSRAYGGAERRSEPAASHAAHGERQLQSLAAGRGVHSRDDQQRDRGPAARAAPCPPRRTFGDVVDLPVGGDEATRSAHAERALPDLLVPRQGGCGEHARPHHQRPLRRRGGGAGEPSLHEAERGRHRDMEAHPVAAEPDRRLRVGVLDEE